MKKFSLCLMVLSMGLAAAPAAAHEIEGAELLRRLDDAFTDVVDRVEDGVVSVSTVREVSYDPYRGTPFEFFFRPQRPQRDNPEEEFRRQQGQGSGFVIRHEGEYYILTNNHVVKGADEILVEMTDDRSFNAEVVGADSLSDLAVLKIDADNLPHLQLGDSDDLAVGQWVLAVGNPFGYEHTVTDGIVSALGRGRFGEEYGSFIQTNAAINPGNSGGPLVGLNGEVVGINTAIVSRSGGYDGIGFAIPVNLVKDVLVQLIEHGEVKRGVLGVELRSIDRDLAEALGMEDTHGVLIHQVFPDLPAAAAGLEQGDVILEVDGKSVKGILELRNKIGRTPPGTEVELLILRKRKEKKVEVVLEQLARDTFAMAQESGAIEVGLGLEIQELTPELARRLGYEMDSGVLVANVKRRREAARRGLRPGELIVEVDQQPVRTVVEYKEVLAEKGPGESVLFLVQRGNNTRFVALRIPRE